MLYKDMETKRNFLYVPLLLAAIFAVVSIFFSSCGEQDLAPDNSVLRLYVENEDGENLLDLATSGNLVGKLEANLNYEGKTYPLSWVELTDPFLSENCMFPKGYPGAVFHGIWYETHPYRGVVDRNHLEIGTFYEPDFKHKRLTVSFPKYGLKYDIELSSRNPKLKVNGKEAEPWQYTIVLPAEKK